MLANSKCASMDPSPSPLNEPYEPFSGKRIASIRFLRLGVFDLDNPEENNRLYAFFNRLHFNTQASTIAAQILFEVGDSLQPDLLAETERLLRSLPYLGNATIFVDDVCMDEVAILVKTRDIWTTEPTFSLGHEGGEAKHGFGLSEENLVGTGNSVAINYDKNDERSSVSYAFHSPHLFNTRLTSDISFAETSDGQESFFALQRPFYSLQTPWAAGVTEEKITATEITRVKGEATDLYRHATEVREVFSGYSLKANRQETHRISAGLTQERNGFEELPDSPVSLPGNESIIYPWLEYRYIENQFSVYHNLNQMHRVEDVSMGADFRLRLGHGGSVTDNEFEVWRYTLRYHDLLDVGVHHLIKYSIAVDGRSYPKNHQLSRAVWGGDVGYYYLSGEKHRSFVQLQYHQGHQLPGHEQLAAGGDNGLRGYPIGYQQGQKRYLLTLEQRYISSLHLFNLFRLGAVVYLDFGRAWDGNYGYSSHLSNVGVGLRMSSTKAKVGNVVHFDLAFPFADKNQVDSFQWVIKATRRL